MNFKNLKPLEDKSIIYTLPLVLAQTITEIFQRKYFLNLSDCIMLSTTISLFIIIEIYNDNKLNSTWFKLYPNKSKSEFFKLISLNAIIMFFAWLINILLNFTLIFVVQKDPFFISYLFSWIMMAISLFYSNSFFITGLSSIISMLIGRYLIPRVIKKGVKK